SSEGSFQNEITPVTIKTKEGEKQVATDEGTITIDPNKITQLRPAFMTNGTVTAANSSSISDGAAALILMRRSQAVKHNITPLARIVAHASHAQDPSWFTTAPIAVIQKLLTKIKWKAEDVDLFEINEAFAVVVLAAIHDLQLSHEKINI